MEIEFTMKIFQMTMTVDETRQDGLAFDIDHLSAGGNRAFTPATDGLKPASLDNNDGVLDRWPSSAIDQFTTLHHEYFLRHARFPSPKQQREFGERRSPPVFRDYFDAPGKSPCLERNSIMKRSKSQGCSI